MNINPKLTRKIFDLIGEINGLNVVFIMDFERILINPKNDSESIWHGSLFTLLFNMIAT